MSLGRRSLLVLAMLSSIAVLISGASSLAAAGRGSSAPTLARPGPSLLAVSALGKRPGITVMTTSGRILPHHSIRVPSQTFAISPDGRQIAYDSGLFAVGIRPVGGGHRTALVHRADDPAWSAEGRELAVDGYGSGAPHYTSNIFTVRPGHAKQLFIRDRHWDTDPTWSPDGTDIAFERETPSGGTGKGRHTGIYLSDGTALRQLISDQDGVAFDPAWSPDGREIAFDDTRNGAHVQFGRTADIYVINVDGTHLRQITHDPKRDDEAPHWSPDGRELAFTVSGDARAGVGIKTLGAGLSKCLLRPTWSDDWPIAWLPGMKPTPEPHRCAHSLVPPQPKPRFGCTSAAARSAVDRSHLPWSFKAYAHHGPERIIKRCVDFTRDGRQDLAVLFDGEGSGGVIAWAAFRRTHHDWKQVVFKSGDRLTLSVEGSDLLETHPVYRRGDCHCDPTGGVAHHQYGWNGHRLVVVAHWHTNH